MAPPLNYMHANAAYLPAGYKYPSLFRRVFLGAYYEPFRERVIEFKAKAAERGCHAWSTHGYRSWAQQHQLRMAYLNGSGGKAAPAGLSAHQYGLADDSTVDGDSDDTNGLQPTWDPKRYDILGEEAERVGLVWGRSFGDRPHVNWPGFTSGTELSTLQRIWNACPKEVTDDGKLRACWSYLDALRGQ